MKLSGTLISFITLAGSSAAQAQVAANNPNVACILNIQGAIFYFGMLMWSDMTHWYTKGIVRSDAVPVATSYDANTRTISGISADGSTDLRISVWPSANGDGSLAAFLVDGNLHYNGVTTRIATNDYNAYGSACQYYTGAEVINFNLCHKGAPRC
ncbi:uncharacterized protein L969DRAFT_92017 [Mixia osmundae IAM 14324]|uniref:Uncharacterized protein n=1 Tax=Mixia osmundae (strain CBS 9802 / IAM 14324 / JCM 22182 / KY 12970) TaxID=764103 RepID=G7DZE4_MIXOS|nr:uncharacterized protein L969DRAFT_92017 [Mixia osmundae IAM 14324]KEI42581.1 hypothetical protein L969DRAFT_92017 [Mixia osmundae IAM 14324]GAA95954.1 hypothetical protein E5Q_02612 [Mixia osmundae IAM 14324]